VQPDREIVYKTVGEAELKLHVFDPSGMQPEKPPAAIILFFGGGWSSGSPEQFYQQCRCLADRGIVAIAAEYRVRNTHGVSPIECVSDCKSAVRWVRSHATEIGVDPERIAAGGGSAGGHVAACAAIVPGLEDEDGEPAVSSVPDALVLFNPVVDMTAKNRAHRVPDGRAGEISPACFVRSGLPPAIVFHGTADTSVPFEGVRSFCREMEEAGNICQLVAFEGGEHGFFNYGREDKEPFRETMRRSEEFLASLGFLGSRPNP